MEPTEGEGLIKEDEEEKREERIIVKAVSELLSLTQCQSQKKQKGKLKENEGREDEAIKLCTLTNK